MWGHRLQVPALVRAPAVSSRAPVWGASPGSHPIAGCRIGFKSCPRVGGISISPLRGKRLRSFKSCPRVGGIADSAAYYDRSIEVSSRAPVWGASLALRLPGCREAFQVVPPCGGHPEQSQSRNAGSGFKSCPRVGGITYELQKQKQELFQVVPPCGGHQLGWLRQDYHLCVSSRAPVWGASGGRCCFWPVCIVSSRAPVWGASPGTLAADAGATVSSRAPVWGASLPGFCCLWYPQVSSRAPVWGASSPVSRVTMGRLCFKSCPRVGGI